MSLPMSQRGQGRKKGGLNKRTKALREVADKAIENGVHPLEVMLNNMRFFHEKVDVLQTAILQKLSNNKLTDKEALQMLAEFKELGANRMKAQTCAVDAAPFVHVKLTATNVTGVITHKVEEAEQAFKLISNVMNSIDAGELVPKSKKKDAA